MWCTGGGRRSPDVSNEGRRGVGALTSTWSGPQTLPPYCQHAHQRKRTQVSLFQLTFAGLDQKKQDKRTDRKSKTKERTEKARQNNGQKRQDKTTDRKGKTKQRTEKARQNNGQKRQDKTTDRKGKTKPDKGKKKDKTAERTTTKSKVSHSYTHRSTSLPPPVTLSFQAAQHPVNKISLGQICFASLTCRHTETQVADQTCPTPSHTY